MMIEQRWYTLDEAPLGVLGFVYSFDKSWGKRTDITGTVHESEGERFASSAAKGFKFTHWHPLLTGPSKSKSPNLMVLHRRAVKAAQTATEYATRGYKARNDRAWQAYDRAEAAFSAALLALHPDHWDPADLPEPEGR